LVSKVGQNHRTQFNLDASTSQEIQQPAGRKRFCFMSIL
jgi:hypothetical protein